MGDHTGGGSALLVELLLRYLPRGRRQGEEFVAPCPFHKGGQESRPSFYINLATGTAFCHTCHEGWFIRTLLGDLGLSRAELDHVSGLFPDRPRKRNLLREDTLFQGVALPELLLCEFQRYPVELLDKGFTKETLRYFEVGYDERRQRIVYPVRNLWGTLVGLYGRIPDNAIDAAGAKYRPYEKELLEMQPGYRFGERQHIWNMHRLYPMAWEGMLDEVILLEGFKQAMWVRQSGRSNVLSLFGSYMTKPQKMLLQRLGGSVVLFLDNDKAGWEGTQRIAKELRGLQQIRVAVYPEGKKQPDDLSLTEAWSCVENAVSLLEWRKIHGLRSQAVPGEHPSRRAAAPTRDESRQRQRQLLRAARHPHHHPADPGGVQGA